MNYGNKRVDGETDNEIYTFVFETAAEILEEITEASKGFPKERVYLADLACKHSKLVCINLDAAWRMKEHRTNFLDKLSDAAEAASKTQDVLKLASKNNYIDGEIFKRIDTKYENIFEDIFSILCEGKKFVSHAKGNVKRSSVGREMVAVA